jgi:hypothetical protein
MSLARPSEKCTETTEWSLGFEEIEVDEEPGCRGEVEERRTNNISVDLPARIGPQDLCRSGIRLISTLGMKEGECVRVTVGHGSVDNQMELEARVVWRKALEGTDRAIYGLTKARRVDGISSE